MGQINEYELGKRYTQEIEQGFKHIPDIGYLIPSEAKNYLELMGLFGYTHTLKSESIKKKNDKNAS